MTEHCIVCGAEIPEGRQVCPICATVAGSARTAESKEKEPILKPCPFCGGKAHLTKSEPYLVYCEGCTATVNSAQYTIDAKADRMDAVNRWNRRVNNV